MKTLVTGGGGFLGATIVRRLIARGDSVRTFQRGQYPWMAPLNVESIRGDLTDPVALATAAKGIDVVFHVAAKAGIWGPYTDYHAANVIGTQNVIAACSSAGVHRLVFTSSPSVVFSGHDESGINESAPYPIKYLAHYPRTKAMAERAVLAANDANLATVSLRPHLIWGPGDPHLVPRIIDRARAGRLRLVGPGTNLVDSTYIDNAALAHILAADHLSPTAACAGKAYFISNGEPVSMRELLTQILHAADIPPVMPSVSPGLAFAAGACLEALHKMLLRSDEPVLTRFVARQLSSAHWYDLTAARRDLGYIPEVPMAQGMRRLADSLRSQQ